LRVLAFTAGASILTGILFGLAPALRSMRVDLTPALKEGGKSSSSGHAGRGWLNFRQCPRGGASGADGCRAGGRGLACAYASKPEKD